MIEHNVTKARKSFLLMVALVFTKVLFLHYHVALWYRHVSCQSFSMDVRTGRFVTVH